MRGFEKNGRAERCWTRAHACARSIVNFLETQKIKHMFGHWGKGVEMVFRKRNLFMGTWNGIDFAAKRGYNQAESVQENINTIL